MKTFLFGMALVAACATSVAARPLLSNSQQTYAGACLDGNETPARLVEICQIALEEAGYSAAQSIAIRNRLANAYYDLDELDRASETLEEILQDAPGDADALRLKGWVHWRHNRFAQAEETFEASIAVAPSGGALAGLASAGRHAGTIEEEQFLILMDTALALSPNYVWAIREKGWGLIDFARPADALAAFEDALEKSPEDPWSLYAVGFALNELGRYGEALEKLNRAASDPQAPTGVYSQRSLANFYSSRYKLALSDADRVIKEWPEDSVGYVRRAKALASMGRRKVAIHELMARLEIRHNDFVAYHLADLLYDDAAYQDAFDVLDRTFHEGDPGYWDHEFRALLLLELGRAQEAEPSIAAALLLRPNSPYPHYYRALARVDEGAYEDAEASMDIALENGLPRDRATYFLEALTRRGEFLRAIQLRDKFRAANSD